jgi:hypothetical protein
VWEARHRKKVGRHTENIDDANIAIWEYARQALASVSLIAFEILKPPIGDTKTDSIISEKNQSARVIVFSNDFHCTLNKD